MHVEVTFRNTRPRKEVRERAQMLPAFHLAYRRKWDRFAKGTLFVMIALVMAIVWLQMEAP